MSESKNDILFTTQEFKIEVFKFLNEKMNDLRHTHPSISAREEAKAQIKYIAGYEIENMSKEELKKILIDGFVAMYLLSPLEKDR